MQHVERKICVLPRFAAGAFVFLQVATHEAATNGAARATDKTSVTKISTSTLDDHR